VQAHFDLLGYPCAARAACINAKKLSPEWTTCLEMLGVGYDTAAFVIFLPADKLEALRKRALESFPASRKKATAKQLQQLVGYLRFVTLVLPSGRFFLRRIIALYAGRAQHHHVRLTASFFSDICWWQAVVAAALQRQSRVECPIELHIQRPPSAVAFSDASGRGLGGYSPDLKFWWSATLPPEVAAAVQDHAVAINTLELLGMLVNATIGVSLGRLPRAAVFKLYGDNSSAVAWINSGAASPLANDLARHLGVLEFHYGVSLSAAHIAGQANTLADRLSREPLDTASAVCDLCASLPSDWTRQVPSASLLSGFYARCLTSSPTPAWHPLL